MRTTVETLFSRETLEVETGDDIDTHLTTDDKSSVVCIVAYNHYDGKEVSVIMDAGQLLKFIEVLSDTHNQMIEG